MNVQGKVTGIYCSTATIAISGIEQLLVGDEVTITIHQRSIPLARVPADHSDLKGPAIEGHVIPVIRSISPRDVLRDEEEKS
jgi:hypothetical protein